MKSKPFFNVLYEGMKGEEKSKLYGLSAFLKTRLGNDVCDVRLIYWILHCLRSYGLLNKEGKKFIKIFADMYSDKDGISE